MSGPESSTVTAREPATNSRRVVREPGGAGGVATSVILAVSEFLEVDPAELRPHLYERIDPDALNRLFGDAGEQTHPEVAFTLNDCRVVVSDDDVVSVTVCTAP